MNYGFGYMGIGFAGGEWRGGHFAYNTAVMHVNTTIIHNTYVNETIVHNTTIVNNNHVAYNGGPGGIQHQPTTEEQTAMHEAHVAPTQLPAATHPGGPGRQDLLCQGQRRTSAYAGRRQAAGGGKPPCARATRNGGAPGE